MSTESNAFNINLIIGTTQVSGTNYAVANKSTPARHLRINGSSGLRSYAGTTGSMAFFYKVTTASTPSVDFSNPTTKVPVGGTVTNTATTSNAGNASISYSSDQTSIASVNSSGVVTGVSEGTATITASITVSGNTYTDSYTITVIEVQDGVFDFTQGYDYGSNLPMDDANHAASTPYVFTAGNVTMTTSGTGNIAWYNTPNLRFYSGSAFTIAVPAGYVITEIAFTGNQYVQNPTVSTGSLSGNGTAATWTGNSQSVTFTRNSQNPFYTVITVTYGLPSSKTPTSLSWSTATATVTMGESNTFPTLTTDPVGLTGVTYSSSDTGVATVASDGTITLVAAGVTTITASFVGDDDYLAADDASYTLTVNPAAGTQPTEVTIGLNNTTYGTSYTGADAKDGINSNGAATGTISNVTVTYDVGTGSYAYINANQTRVYSGNTLTFTAPTGYVITNIAFTTDGAITLTAEDGTMDNSNKTWSDSSGYSSVVFSASSTSKLISAVVTLAADIPDCVTNLTFTPTAINLFASGTFTPSGTVESGAGTITYTYECETEGLAVTSAGAYTASAVGTYDVTITATPSNTSEYKAVSAVVEVTVTDSREATVTTFPEESYTVVLGQAFTGPTATTKTTPGDVTLPSERATYTYTSSNTSVARVDAATGAVTIIDAGATTITATYAGDDTDYQGSAGSYALHVTDPNADEYTWDLTTDSYYSADATAIVWSSEVASMTAVQENSSGVAANNYIPTERNSTRFYNGETLTISPAAGNTITSIVFEATTEGYASVLANCTWTNATVTVSGTTVTVTPTDGTTDIVANITGTCGFTGVTVHYSNASAVAKPVISPATGKYSERPQTVSITCTTDGATIYYTTDGTIPTTSSSVYTGSFTVNRKTTIMAIAVKDGNQSRTASVDISFEVTAPQFNYETLTSFDDGYTVTITAQTGVTIYYITQSDQMYVTSTGTTNDPTNSTIVTDDNGNPRLVSSARVYGDPLTFSQAMMITAVAVDADGNQSDPVTVEYQYTGTVGIPYTSRFASTLGDFTTVANPITSTLYWRINTNKGADAIAKWGEERAYAYISGKNHTSGDKASLTSPIFDLTDYEEASFSFIHAGAYFESIAESQTYCKVYVDVLDLNGAVSSTDQVTVPGWYNLDKTAAGKYAFTRANSGDIDLTSYAGEKIQIRFEFTVPNDVTTYYGTWNVDQVTVLATKAETETEKVAMNNKGWTTYVFDHDIDAYTTTNKYSANGKTLKIFKVTEFDHETCVLQQLGLVENHVDGDDDSERYIKAKTPVVIYGPASETIEYDIYTESVVNLVKNNLLLASLNPDPAVAPVGSGERYFVLQWNNTTNAPWFNKVSEGREIPDHRAYLNGTDQMDHVTAQSNPVKGIYVLGEEEEEATGIVNVENVVNTKDNQFYNLAGQRVMNPTKGIYIVNGKKVFIK